MCATIERCVICGKNGHTSKGCRAPGGQLDPDKEKAWERYRARREEAQPKKGKGEKGKGEKGKGGKGTGKKGKGKGKGKDDEQQPQAPPAKAGAPVKPNAKAAVVASANAKNGGDFPAGAVGLDSWANVWLKHVDSSETHEWSEPLRLADGSSTPCRTGLGPKGIPQAQVEARPDQENIDLLPMYWLIERWCQVQWNDKVSLTTPKNRTFVLKCWNKLPYLTKKQLEQTLEDLPEPTVPGRSGKAAGARVASAFIVLGPRTCTARVHNKKEKRGAKAVHSPPALGCPGIVNGPAAASAATEESEETVASAVDYGPPALGCSGIVVDPEAESKSQDEKSRARRLTRDRLKHLAVEFDRDHREKMVTKYQCMPDIYYGDGPFIGPQELGKDDVMNNLGLTEGSPVQLWEFMAGSGKLSATAREKDISHLPPVDHRWGYHVGRFSDQMQLLYALLVFGCEVLFASPNCTPWGNNSRGWEKKKLRRERASQGLSLQFLTVLCLLQVIMGRSYIVEGPKGSDMYTESPISLLQHESLPSEQTLLDQCAFGASMDEGLIRKGTELKSDQRLPELNRTCSGDHDHVHLRGTNKKGSRTAQSAVYPDGLCQVTVEEAVPRISTTRSGGSISIITGAKNTKKMTQEQLVMTILSELKVHAKRQGRREVWDQIVTPWIQQHQQLKLKELEVDAELHLAVVKIKPRASEVAAVGASSQSPRPRVSRDGEQVPNSSEPLKRIENNKSELEERKNVCCKCASHGTDAWSPRPRVSRDSVSVSMPRAAPGTVVEESSQTSDEQPKSEPRVQDIVKGTLKEDPWQFKPYDKASATWLAAAQRRHQHRRRTNAVLGTAAVDLSGPHEPTPMVGSKIGQRPGHYFVVLTITRDDSLGFVDRGTQTEGDGEQEVGSEGQQNDQEEDDVLPSGLPLLYAAVVSNKSQAAAAVQRMLARVRDDHGHLPGHVVFRLHSDKGQEFLPETLEKYCELHGIRRTTTAGYDPSANGTGENAVGYLKRKGRQLLTGARLPSSWWGTAVLASAFYSRCAAGLEEWPKVPYGTRVMVVKDPAPRNAFVPRALPATVFGPSERVPGGMIAFQDGRLKEVVNIQISDLDAEDLVFVKGHMQEWATPIAPCAVPTSDDWDATRVGSQSHPSAPTSSFDGQVLMPEPADDDGPLAEAPQV